MLLQSICLGMQIHFIITSCGFEQCPLLECVRRGMLQLHALQDQNETRVGIIRFRAHSWNDGH